MARPPLRTEDSADGSRVADSLRDPSTPKGSRSSSPAPRLRPSLFFSPTHRNRLDHLPVARPTGEAGRSSARQSHDLRLPGRAEGWLRPPEARPCRARGKLQKTLDSGRTLSPMVSFDGSLDGFACAMVLRWLCLCDGFPLLWFSSFSSGYLYLRRSPLRRID
jgi:hypothetical protein